MWVVWKGRGGWLGQVTVNSRMCRYNPRQKSVEFFDPLSGYPQQPLFSFFSLSLTMVPKGTKIIRKHRKGAKLPNLA